MMKILLYFETLVYLKPKQVFYQIAYRLYRPSLKNVSAPAMLKHLKIIPPISKNKCYDGKDFVFLNIKDDFHTWCQTEHGMLWAYNLNYMDWLQEDGISDKEGEAWIDKFIQDLSQNHVGQDTYPTALRTINWVKFFCKYPECATKERCDSLYSQVKLVERELEWHLLGNHLLEDIYALFIASIYFCDYKLYNKASKLLKKQLNDQILLDGAHFEQSPMYHCILLDRLLDCYNFSVNNILFDQQTIANSYLKDKAEKMLGHLESIIWQDGSIPLLNDSVYGIAPSSEQLFDYARRLGLTWKSIPLNECGYRKMKSKRFEAIIDIGNIMSPWQPGHSHADTFSYELHVDDIPFVVDTGISTYNKTLRRQYERSTAAHNTVTIQNQDSSRVWGGFRMGRRAKVKIIKDSTEEIMAEHEGFGMLGKHCRRIFFDKLGLHIEDYIDSEVKAISYIHFAPGMSVSVGENHELIYADKYIIRQTGCDNPVIIESEMSKEYNQLINNVVVALPFTGRLSYTFVYE